MGRSDFKSWLVRYKEYGDKKAENICSAIDRLSEEALECGSSETPLYSVDSYTGMGKWRRSLGEQYCFTANDNKVIYLFGDYLDYISRTNHVVSDTHEIKLLEYCTSMSMSYSYKAVLLLVMIENISADGKLPIDVLVKKMIDYYDQRKKENKTVEQENSIFARFPIVFEDAKKNVISNPIQVLVKAGVVRKEDNEVRLASAYYTDPDDYELVKKACSDRLNAYYERLELMVNAGSRQLSPLDALEEAINKIKNEEDRNNCIRAMTTYKSSIGVASDPDVRLKRRMLLNKSDERKIGKLVRDTMNELSSIGFSFSDEEYALFFSKDWSKSTLGIYYPFFRPFQQGIPIEDQIKDHLGNGRYYKQVFVFGDRQVLLTSEWYKESKPSFINWFNSLIEQQ